MSCPILASKYYSALKDSGLLVEIDDSELKQTKHNMGLEHPVSESKEVLEDDEIISKRH